MAPGISAILTLLLTIVAIILIYINVMKEDSTHSPVAKELHGFFNFKKLWIESFIRFCYVLSTVFTVVYGVLSIITDNGITFFGSIGIILLGVFGIRLIFEIYMMFILLVKNVIQINNRLEQQEHKLDNWFKKPEQPQYQAQSAQSQQ